jgi:hypothetical protein
MRTEAEPPFVFEERAQELMARALATVALICAVGLKQGHEAVVVLPTRRAALQVGSQPRDRAIGVGSRELELYVAIQLLEALVAAQLRLRRPK